MRQWATRPWSWPASAITSSVLQFPQRYQLLWSEALMIGGAGIAWPLAGAVITLSLIVWSPMGALPCCRTGGRSATGLSVHRDFPALFRLVLLHDQGRRAFRAALFVSACAPREL